MLHCKKSTSTYHLVLLALATGLRRGEIAALKWKNVDTLKNTIKVNKNLVEVSGGLIFGTPKSRAGFRTIAVSEAVIKELQTIKDDSKLVFHTSAVNRYHPVI